jgi:uncharacterized protein YjbJ (UPF0337 family)
MGLPLEGTELTGATTNRHSNYTSATEKAEAKMSSGTTDKTKGRVKEAAGALLDDKKLKREGKVDQLVGKVKVAAEKTIDKAKKLVSRR